MNGTALASMLVPRLEDARGAFLVHAHVGRLVGLRLSDPVDRADIQQLVDDLSAVSSRVAEPMILIADYRAASPFAQEVGDAWSRAMRRFNGSVERSAVLLDPANETFNLQFARVVRCAGMQHRCCFEDAALLRAWISSALSPAERARLDELLSLGPT
ncbi:MAG: hypothetical protein ACRENE_17915 [Polyangiaceae bacterium]